MRAIADSMEEDRVFSLACEDRVGSMVTSNDKECLSVTLCCLVAVCLHICVSPRAELCSWGAGGWLARV